MIQLSQPMKLLLNLIFFQSTVRRLSLNENLDLFPYKVKIHQPVSEAAIEVRYEFANTIENMPVEDHFYPENIIFTDACHLNGYVSTFDMNRNIGLWRVLCAI